MLILRLGHPSYERWREWARRLRSKLLVLGLVRLAQRECQMVSSWAKRSGREYCRLSMAWVGGLMCRARAWELASQGELSVILLENG